MTAAPRARAVTMRSRTAITGRPSPPSDAAYVEHDEAQPGAGTAAPQQNYATGKACTCHRVGGLHESLTGLLTVRTGPETAICRWRAGVLLDDNTAALDEAACIVADLAMQWRCRGAEKSYELWRDAVNRKAPLDEKGKGRVVPFFSTVFGVPGKPRPPEHLCGWVAEFVWYQLTREALGDPNRVLYHLEGPGFHATEPGGDGLAVWRRNSDDQLTFCLWEVKNHVASAAVTGTISRAYRQLGERATEYLAKLTGVSALRDDDDELRQFYSDLVEMWVDDSERSGVGIAVGTHSRLTPDSAFSTMHKYFPGKQRPWQLEGLIAGIGDFDKFANSVKERVWTAL